MRPRVRLTCGFEFEYQVSSDFGICIENVQFSCFYPAVGAVHGGIKLGIKQVALKTLSYPHPGFNFSFVSRFFFSRVHNLVVLIPARWLVAIRDPLHLLSQPTMNVLEYLQQQAASASFVYLGVVRFSGGCTNQYKFKQAIEGARWTKIAQIPNSFVKSIPTATPPDISQAQQELQNIANAFVAGGGGHVTAVVTLVVSFNTVGDPVDAVATMFNVN